MDEPETDYRALLIALRGTEEMEVEGFSTRLLGLETLIRLKEESTHPKDQAVLPILRQLMEERDRP